MEGVLNETTSSTLAATLPVSIAVVDLVMLHDGFTYFTWMLSYKSAKRKLCGFHSTDLVIAKTTGCASLRHFTNTPHVVSTVRVQYST